MIRVLVADDQALVRAGFAMMLGENVEITPGYGMAPDALTYRNATSAWIELDRRGVAAAWQALAAQGEEPDFTFGGRMWFSARLTRSTVCTSMLMPWLVRPA